MENSPFSTSKQFYYNPYGGLHDKEIQQVIVPIDTLEQIQSAIADPSIKIVELRGKKGRGKTSHLKFLHQQYPQSALIQLRDKQVNFEQIYHSPQKLLFIDSLHHLSLKQRFTLYKGPHQIILTTHTPRFLEYKWVGIPSKSFHFKGITTEKLVQIIQNRIRLASGMSNEITFPQVQARQLIQKFGDDYRAILRHLYKNFEG